MPKGELCVRSAVIPVLTTPAPVYDVPRTFFGQSLLEYSWRKWNMIQGKEKRSRVRTTAVQRGLWATSQWLSPVLSLMRLPWR